jgi:hypothetical protein
VGVWVLISGAGLVVSVPVVTAIRGWSGEAEQLGDFLGREGNALQLVVGSAVLLAILARPDVSRLDRAVTTSAAMDQTRSFGFSAASWALELRWVTAYSALVFCGTAGVLISVGFQDTANVLAAFAVLMGMMHITLGFIRQLMPRVRGWNLVPGDGPRTIVDLVEIRRRAAESPSGRRYQNGFVGLVGLLGLTCAYLASYFPN